VTASPTLLVIVGTMPQRKYIYIVEALGFTQHTFEGNVELLTGCATRRHPQCSPGRSCQISGVVVGFE
jgi:hypothetical protein